MGFKELLAAIERNKQTPNMSETSDMGALETFDPKYNRTKPEWETAKSDAGTDSVNAIAEEGLSGGPRSAAVGNESKMKPLTHREITAMEAPDRNEKKKAEIKKLLADYDAASRKSKQDSFAAGLSEAGMEFGHAFGGDPVDKNFINGIRDRANIGKQDVLKKNDLSLEQDKNFRENDAADQRLLMNSQGMDNIGLDMQKKQMGLDNEANLIDQNSDDSVMLRQIGRDMGFDMPETADGRSIINVLPMARERLQQVKAAQHEQESTKRTGIIAANQHRMNIEDNATGLAKAGMAQQYKEFVGGMRAQDQQMKLRERMIPGLKFKNIEEGFIPNITAVTKARDLSGQWQTADKLLTQAINILQKNPRNFPLSKEWNQLKSMWPAIANAKNKLQENGVMNFGDWDHIMMEIGDPNSAVQWVNQGGLTRLMTSRETGKTQYMSRLDGYGYEPGNMSLGQVPGQSGSGGMGGSGGPVNRVGQNDINGWLNQAGMNPIQGKTATENGPKSPVQEPTRQVKKKVFDKKAGTWLIEYSDGSFDEVQ